MNACCPMSDEFSLVVNNHRYHDWNHQLIQSVLFYPHGSGSAQYPFCLPLSPVFLNSFPSFELFESDLSNPYWIFHPHRPFPSWLLNDSFRFYSQKQFRYGGGLRWLKRLSKEVYNIACISREVTCIRF